LLQRSQNSGDGPDDPSMPQLYPAEHGLKTHSHPVRRMAFFGRDGLFRPCVLQMLLKLGVGSCCAGNDHLLTDLPQNAD